MKICAGFHLGYECERPTPMVLVLNIQPSRRADLTQTLLRMLGFTCHEGFFGVEPPILRP
jgi:hypothetical protein